MSVTLLASGGGSLTIQEPVTTSNFTQTMVAATEILAPIVSGTAVASTSGTSVEFTGIPSWAKRITMMFSGVSTNGASITQIQLGSGTYTTSGYLGSRGGFNATAGAVLTTTGFATNSASANSLINGSVSLLLLNASTNTWVCSGVLSLSDQAYVMPMSGAVSLSGTLDRVRFTTVNGTDVFDAGIINILYE